MKKGKSKKAIVIENDLKVIKENPDDKVIALAGNPNVGKSTVFNGLTGLNQHTGNWPGKTVANAQGRFTYNCKGFILVDIPGTYSLMASSAEEEIARDFICFGNPDCTVVVADATCLERNLNLVLQTLEITDNVIVCVNLLDEAKRKKINIDLKQLSLQLGVPVVGASARSGEGLDELAKAVYKMTNGNERIVRNNFRYDDIIENAIKILEPSVHMLTANKLNSRWLSLKLLDPDKVLHKAVTTYLGFDILKDNTVRQKRSEALEYLKNSGIDTTALRDRIVGCIVKNAETVYSESVVIENKQYNTKDRKIDRLLTSKATGIPIMLLLLSLIFWITLVGANYPSELISRFLFWIEDQLTVLFNYLGAPKWLHGVLVLGMYRTLAWVVSVMLPPMAIFFPLFTLLEDSGYLPRIAFNLDKFFKKACAHGKQSLTMAMGFGCNACGVIGCRIIDSPRERLIAVITNNFVPCNGRFPTLIAIITMFFAGMALGAFKSVISTLILTGVIVLGVAMTLFISKMLSKTILKGMPSSFILELPPYRKPKIGKVIVRSICDRTLFVLRRAVMVAAPAGAVIWITANIKVGNVSILTHCAMFLDPFAKAIGLDGYILMAFILGFPANEIVMPIIIMSYMATGSIIELDNLSALHNLLVANGWTPLTAVCTMLFSLFHFPCATTCLTIKKETQSIKWTAVSFLVPTCVGIIVCFAVTAAVRVIGLL